VSLDEEGQDLLRVVQLVRELIQITLAQRQLSPDEKSALDDMVESAIKMLQDPSSTSLERLLALLIQPVNIWVAQDGLPPITVGDCI